MARTRSGPILGHVTPNAARMAPNQVSLAASPPSPPAGVLALMETEEAAHESSNPDIVESDVDVTSLNPVPSGDSVQDLPLSVDTAPLSSRIARVPSTSSSVASSSACSREKKGRKIKNVPKRRRIHSPQPGLFVVFSRISLCLV